VDDIKAMKPDQPCQKHKKLKRGYHAKLAAHKALQALEKDGANLQHFFPGKPAKKSSSGLEYKNSIMTDGVSVSLSYKRQIKQPKQYWKPDAKTKVTKEPPEKQQAGPYHAALTSWAERTDELVLVLGLDPGRVNIATIMMQNAASKFEVWSLSGGQYHFESGTSQRTKAKAIRYQSLKSDFQGLADEGSALNTPVASDIEGYSSRCATFWMKWFRTAMRRRESRDALGSYMGKRSVLDRFYVNVLQKVQLVVQAKAKDECAKAKKERRNARPLRVEVAYGSAGPSMAATGPGQLAVPTTTSYLCCRRIMGSFSMEDGQGRKVKLSTELVDEYNTSAVSWQSGVKFDKVYRTVEPDGKTTAVRSYKGKYAPSIPDEEKQGVQKWQDRIANRAKKRRGGSVPVEACREEWSTYRRQTYPEVRGLRFCPEMRKFVDRDVAAAGTIARLRVHSLLGLARPVPFART
jgi:hypothetical protein